MSNQNGLKRYTGSERLNHWLIALLFVLAGLSGLAMFHPSMFFLSGLFGGGSLTRIVHPFIGSAMFVLFLIISLRFWHHNVLNKNDIQWLKQIGDVMANHEERLPEVGRYNGGQKAAFWVMVVSMIALVVTGVMFWRPYFVDYFSVDVRRIAAVVHAVAAWGLILTIIVHVYAAIWVKGTIGGMRTGMVSRAWARKHHPGWYKEETGQK